MNIPNILSVFRIALIPIFGYVYLNAQEQPWFYVAALILLLSGITDFLDGVIARKFNMITQLGKILDPLADKLTQAAACIMLGIRNPEFWVILALFIIKEIIMLLAGLKIYRRDKELEGSKWFGKLYTVVFYIIMLMIIGFPNLKTQLVFSLLVIMAVFMLFAFFMYIPVFLKLNKKKD
ncbi:cardiolipin synthase [Hydrogenoanaerobacterium saccharovorans]|uniref:Phosphatidylglycerophosphate synthase n=1 Tax=Hydrogenoanaerobacterium saccharovorans TaxID=474960 RepID=A0A1H8AZS5_9FIRM|nr:CDP-alcohol phosphatidyltransferase family protein [Hydrogenoanaerobacterium saccharovorans]RPF47661.1 cardiolipin synthase [Hydrogenoanaerobacterium saccharovorans]SEM76222.1 cardiolipin synthase [Hydrogenoanaerobacterium saccharovorans]